MEQPSTRLRRRIPALVGLVAVVAAACSDGGRADDERSAAAELVADATSTTTTAPAEPPESASTSATQPAPAPSATAPPPTAARPAAPAPRPGAALDLTGMTVIGPAPTDPAELGRMADDLVAAETALRDPATAAGDVAALALRQQSIYRAIAARPEVLPAVLERVPENLRRAVDANVVAGVELRALAGKPRTSLPTEWRIIPPPAAAELEGYYREAEARFGVPWAYLASVHLVESRMGRIRGTSEAGAQGPMQFMPATWAAYGEGDINNPRDAIMAAARYLHANGAPGDMAKALWHYNHSNRYVRAVTLYAQQIEADPRAYLGYYHWQVFYITTQGDVLLPEGYGT